MRCGLCPQFSGLGNSVCVNATKAVLSGNLDILHRKVSHSPDV